MFATASTARQCIISRWQKLKSWDDDADSDEALESMESECESDDEEEIRNPHPRLGQKNTDTYCAESDSNVSQYLISLGGESLELENDIVGDDESAVSSMSDNDSVDRNVREDWLRLALGEEEVERWGYGEAEEKREKTFPREDWEYISGMTRQDIMQTICDNKTSNEDLTVVQIAQRGNTPGGSLKHFFLTVPDIIARGSHESKIIPSDSLFAMLQVDGIISVYDEDGRQVGNDRTSWDIYAHGNDETVIFFAVDMNGINVGKVEVPRIGGTLKWFSLLHHMERDRTERANEERDPLTHPLAVIRAGDTCLISAHLYLVFEQIHVCCLTEPDGINSGLGIGSPGLQCKHCSEHAGCTDRFRYFPASEVALSRASEEIANHVHSCKHCPFQIREELDALKRSSASLVCKRDRFLRSRKKKDCVNVLNHRGRKEFFSQLWNRLFHHPVQLRENPGAYEIIAEDGSVSNDGVSSAA